MDAARKRPRRRLSPPAAAGQGLAPTTAGNAADSAAAGNAADSAAVGRADRRVRPFRRTGAGTDRAGAGTHRAGAGTDRAGAGTHRAGAGTHRAGAGRCSGPVLGWHRRGGRTLSKATSNPRLVSLGGRHHLGLARAWSRWPGTRWRPLPLRCESGRPEAKRLLRLHARRPRRTASPASIAGHTERRTAENRPKRLLIR